MLASREWKGRVNREAARAKQGTETLRHTHSLSYPLLTGLVEIMLGKSRIPEFMKARN